MDILTEIIKPYGIPVMIVCVATFIVLQIATAICKKYKLTIHTWYKVIATFAISAIYVAIAVKFTTVQEFIGDFFSLGSFAATAYSAVIKYIVSWITDTASKINTQPPAPPTTSGSQTPPPPPAVNIALGK